MQRRLVARPAGLGDPASGVASEPGQRRLRVAHPDAQWRLVQDPGPLVQQPVAPPAQRLLQPADGRARAATAGVAVAPGPDQALLRPAQVLQQARHGVGVAVVPAAHGIDGNRDAAPVLADRALAPVGVARLVRQPGLRPAAVGGAALCPERLPVRALLRIGRQRVQRQDEGGPQRVLGEVGAAHVVHVVGEAVVRAAERDDGPQRRGPQRRHLQRIEAAPGDPGHADPAVAPGLRRQPGDDLAEVLLLQRQVLVLQHAIRLAAAAQVEAAVGNALFGVPGRHLAVAEDGAVAPAIGHGLQHHGRHARGSPQRGGQARAVGQRDEERVLDRDAHGAGGAGGGAAGGAVGEAAGGALPSVFSGVCGTHS